MRLGCMQGNTNSFESLAQQDGNSRIYTWLSGPDSAYIYLQISQIYTQRGHCSLFANKTADKRAVYSTHGICTSKIPPM